MQNSFGSETQTETIEDSYGQNIRSSSLYHHEQGLDVHRHAPYIYNTYNRHTKEQTNKYVAYHIKSPLKIQDQEKKKGRRINIRLNIMHLATKSIHQYCPPCSIQPEVVVEEQSQSASTSCRWKLRWQLQAAHMSASTVPSAPSAMNSRHPSTAYPPMLAAWLRWHSMYCTTFVVSFLPFAAMDGSCLGPIGYLSSARKTDGLRYYGKGVCSRRKALFVTVTEAWTFIPGEEPLGGCSKITG
jgi:hypothetical protein